MNREANIMKPLSYPLPQFKFILMINFLQMNKITGHTDPESVIHNAVFYIKVFKFPKDPVSPLINISSSHCVPNWLNFMILPLMPHIIYWLLFFDLERWAHVLPPTLSWAKWQQTWFRTRGFRADLHTRTSSKVSTETGLLTLVFLSVSPQPVLFY